MRLAPLYDIASAFPYFDLRKLKLGMKVGNHYRLTEITGRDWDVLGALTGLRIAGSARVRELAEQVLQQLPRVANELRDQGLAHPVINQIEGTIRQFANSKIT